MYVKETELCHVHISIWQLEICGWHTEITTDFQPPRLRRRREDECDDDDSFDGHLRFNASTLVSFIIDLKQSWTNIIKASFDLKLGFFLSPCLFRFRSRKTDGRKKKKKRIIFVNLPPHSLWSGNTGRMDVVLSRLFRFGLQGKDDDIITCIRSSFGFGYSSYYLCRSNIDRYRHLLDG